jgi:hypothetical protein
MTTVNLIEDVWTLLLKEYPNKLTLQMINSRFDQKYSHEAIEKCIRILLEYGTAKLTTNPTLYTLSDQAPMMFDSTINYLASQLDIVIVSLNP